MSSHGDGDESVACIEGVQQLQEFFFRAVSPRVELNHEDGRVIALMSGRPFVSEGATVDDALVALAESLREYAEDWEARLQQAPNHRENWALVQLIKLSSGDELLNWLEHGGE